MNKAIKTLLAAALLAAPLVLTACDAGDSNDTDQAAPQAQTGAATAPAAELPAGLLVPVAPEGAKNIVAAKQSIKEGEEVTIRGRVGGRVDPIGENRAILTLVDDTVQTCDRMTGDSCPTPWDACCVAPDDLKPKLATVQVVDAEGRPLKGTLSGLGGLAPLKEITVRGKIYGPTDANNLVVNATAIHVKS